MSIAIANNVVVFGLIIFFVLIAFQVFLSTRENIIFGFILPAFF